MSKLQWVRRWKSWIAEKPTLPGVFKRKEGGWLVRGRAIDARTGKQKEVKLTLLEVDARRAYDVLQEELRKIRTGESRVEKTKIRFDAYAASLLERKVATGEIASAKTRELWGLVLEKHLLPRFGEFIVEEIRRADIERWRTDIGKQIQTGSYSPVYANGWLRILRTIVNAAYEEHEWTARNPLNGVKPFDESLHVAYSEEEPNSLEPEEVPLFLAKMRELYPQHFAMVVLGFVTGLRPSSLRPLRRGGKTPDLLLDGAILYVRRSHTLGEEVMETTKTKRRQRIALPAAVVDILKWHIDSLPVGPMRDSELLFPSETGGYRASSVLKKPFDAVAKATKSKKHLSPRAMRRTFQDLARAASVGDLVTRAVSGHQTEDMQRHYSTVRVEEMRSSLARVAEVVDLAAFRTSGVPSGVLAKGEEKSA